MTAKHKSAIKYRIYLALTILFSIGFVFSVVMFFINYGSYGSASDLYDRLAREVAADDTGSLGGPGNRDTSGDDISSDSSHTSDTYAKAPDKDSSETSEAQNPGTKTSDPVTEAQESGPQTGDTDTGDSQLSGSETQGAELSNPATGDTESGSYGTIPGAEGNPSGSNPSGSNPSGDTAGTSSGSVQSSSGTEGASAQSQSGQESSGGTAGTRIPQPMPDIPARRIDWNSLREINEDVYAWIYIPGTMVDYPVVQSPRSSDYYLNHNLDGSYGYPSCIYSEYLNHKDFNDYNTVLYGHNMTNGTMFGSLHDYEDSEFFDEWQYVFVYTPDRSEPFVYRIYAAVTFGTDHLLTAYRYHKESEYTKFLDDLEGARGMTNQIREEARPSNGEKLLTLSTCVSYKSNVRYIVVGVLINDD